MNRAHTARELITDLENLKEEILSKIGDIKHDLRSQADRDIYEAARRTWIAEIELALGENSDGWLAQRDDIDGTIADLKEAADEEVEEGHTEPEEQCKVCAAKPTEEAAS